MLSQRGGRPPYVFPSLSMSFHVSFMSSMSLHISFMSSMSFSCLPCVSHVFPCLSKSLHVSFMSLSCLFLNNENERREKREVRGGVIHHHSSFIIIIFFFMIIYLNFIRVPLMKTKLLSSSACRAIATIRCPPRTTTHKRRSGARETVTELERR